MRVEIPEFFATQTLHKINFEVSRCSNTGIFAGFDTLNFVLCKFQPSKIEKKIIIKFQFEQQKNSEISTLCYVKELHFREKKIELA